MNKPFFAHANGFPGRTYHKMFYGMDPYQVYYIDMLGHGKYSAKNGWFSLAQELIDHLDFRQLGPVIGIGHSLGGILSYWAARERPDLFKAVIMLDPPMLGPGKRVFLKLASTTGLLKYLPPASKARTRRTHFNSREEALSYFAGKSLFRKVDPDCLQDYVTYGLKPSADGEGFSLRFSAEVEYQLFFHTPLRLGLKRLEVPSYFVHSNSEEVLSARNIQWLKNQMPDTSFIPMAGGHLFPLERPQETASMLKSLIESL